MILEYHSGTQSASCRVGDANVGAMQMCYMISLCCCVHSSFTAGPQHMCSVCVSSYRLVCVLYQQFTLKMASQGDAI